VLTYKKYYTEQNTLYLNTTKEEELTQKQKHREEIKKEKSHKIGKKTPQKAKTGTNRKSKCTKKIKPGLSPTMGSEDDAKKCSYCNEHYTSSKSGVP